MITCKHQLFEMRKSVAGHHKIWCRKAGEKKCVDYENRDAGDKGLGLFTMRDFKQGEKILVERAVTVTVSTGSERADMSTLISLRLRMKAYGKRQQPLPRLKARTWMKSSTQTVSKNGCF